MTEAAVACASVRGAMTAGKQTMPDLRYLGIRTRHFHNLTEQMQGYLRGPAPLFPGELQHESGFGTLVIDGCKINPSAHNVQSKWSTHL